MRDNPEHLINELYLNNREDQTQLFQDDPVTGGGDRLGKRTVDPGSLFQSANDVPGCRPTWHEYTRVRTTRW